MSDLDILPRLPLHLQKQDITFTFWCRGEPKGELDVTHFGADEKISGLSCVHLTLASRNRAIDLNSLLDTPATLSIACCLISRSSEMNVSNSTTPPMSNAHYNGLTTAFTSQ